MGKTELQNSSVFFFFTNTTFFSPPVIYSFSYLPLQQTEEMKFTSTHTHFGGQGSTKMTSGHMVEKLVEALHLQARRS